MGETTNDGSQPIYRLFGIPIHRRIRTGQPHTPWISVFMLSLVWFTFGFNIFAGGQALTFTIQHFTKDFQSITLIQSVGSLLVLGPFISYLSDQVWTRFGRRKPFIVIGWAGGALGMFAFAFIGDFMSALGGGLHLIHVPTVSLVVLLGLVVLGYKKLFDLAAPMEPLFMETVAPQQRGRFFAIRGILFTLSITFFYQVLWPNFDNPVDLFAWLGHPGALVLKGEQLIYLFASAMFTITSGFLILCIEEVKTPGAPNHRLRDMFMGSTHAEHGADKPQGVETRLIRVVRSSAVLRFILAPFSWFFGRTPIGRFIANFFRDVFLCRENIPFYLIMVIPGIEGAVWGSASALMGNDQFGYSKANQALWAFPIQLIMMCAVTPFSGWYSDVRLNVRWWLRVLLLLIAAGCAIAVYRMYHAYAPADIRELPELWVITVMSILLALGSVCVVIPVVETVLDRVGREHARAWIALLTVFKSMMLTVALYIWIRNSPGNVPSITSWMVFGVVGMSLGGVIDTFLAPMIYDYIPRSQMGTVAAGTIFYGALMGFLGANLGAWWVSFYSTNVGHPAHVPYDYTCVYLLQFVMFVPVIAVKVYFLRLILTGRMRKRGLLEVDQAAAPVPAKAH